MLFEIHGAEGGGAFGNYPPPPKKKKNSNTCECEPPGGGQPPQDPRLTRTTIAITLIVTTMDHDIVYYKVVGLFILRYIPAHRPLFYIALRDTFAPPTYRTKQKPNGSIAFSPAASLSLSLSLSLSSEEPGYLY